MTSYVHKGSDIETFNKHGIDITVYPSVPTAGLCHVHIDEGHFQEFKDTVSTFMYYVISGFGTFVLDDEKSEVEPGDVVIIPPGTRIHYFGTMDMVLVVSPAWAEENEVHIRFVDKSESPYLARELE